MITIDSPNIFWQRIKSPQDDSIKLTSFHDTWSAKDKYNRKFAVKYLYSGFSTKWFDDPSMKYRLEGWWLH